MIDYNKIKQEYKELSQKLSLDTTIKDRENYQQLAKRFSFLEKIINLINNLENLQNEKKQLESVINNSGEEEEFKNLAKEEVVNLDKKIRTIEKEIENKLFEEEEPSGDVIIEIRAAAGGEESALFAADLFKMYSKYIERKGWKLEVLNSHPTEIKGFKEIIFSVKGEGAYSRFKFESGVHRVQRIPITEAGGRIHTSTVTVAVLIEPKEIEIKLKPDDLKIETFRASGKGGQHVNRTDSAVRITHIPTGIVVSCQDERSQIKNREKAMKVLKFRILDKMEREQTSSISKQRRVQIGTGERSEKIRTYNFPERRVTDHRINLTLYKLEEILEGNLDELFDRLIEEERKKIYQMKGLTTITQ
ncbi:MAG: peptide chain release factor 1 [Candidatus Omnitrophica bacterium]|nr:peptide chain release factor 1 [Candidatus Omnitrophota bacterium]